jgi:hypothetical protein
VLIETAPKNGRTRSVARAGRCVRPSVAYSHARSNASGFRPGPVVAFDLLWPIPTKGRTESEARPGPAGLFDLLWPMQTKVERSHPGWFLRPREPPGRPAQPPSSPSPGADRATTNRPPNPGRPRGADAPVPFGPPPAGALIRSRRVSARPQADRSARAPNGPGGSAEEAHLRRLGVRRRDRRSRRPYRADRDRRRLAKQRREA